MRKATLAIALVLFAFATAAAVSGGPAKIESAPELGPLFPAATFQNVQVPASNFNLDLAFVEYGPGASSTMESNQGTRFFVVSEGEMTIMLGDKTATYATGKSLMVPAGTVTKLSNAGTKPARVYSSSIVPTWAASNPSTVLASAGATAPKILSSGSVPVKEQRSVVDMTLQAYWLDPGAAFPTHVMNEYNRGLILEGAATFEYLDGGRVMAPAGQVQTMDQGRPGTAANRGTMRLVLTHTWLSAPGKELVTFLPAGASSSAGPAPRIAPPSTGDAGLASEIESALPGGVYVALIFAASAGAGLLLTAASRRVSARRN